MMVFHSIKEVIKMENYNGWTNRNTWLVNLWFGDLIRDMLEEDCCETPENLQAFIMEIIDEEVAKCSFMLRDFLDFDGINWGELWENICMDIFEGEQL
jgi:hypothetical protein